MRPLAALLVIAVIPATALAQDRFPPDSGTRVRVIAPRYYLFQDTGTVTGSDQFALDVNLEKDGEDVALPYPDIARLEVSRGMERMTLVGALGGAVLGALIGAMTTPNPETAYDAIVTEPRGGDPAPRMALGFIVGGFAGGVLGSAVKMERWEPVFSARRRF